jgi:hypothetical protein
MMSPSVISGYGSAFRMPTEACRVALKRGVTRPANGYHQHQLRRTRVAHRRHMANEGMRRLLTHIRVVHAEVHGDYDGRASGASCISGICGLASSALSGCLMSLAMWSINALPPITRIRHANKQGRAAVLVVDLHGCALFHHQKELRIAYCFSTCRLQSE